MWATEYLPVRIGECAGHRNRALAQVAGDQHPVTGIGAQTAGLSDHFHQVAIALQLHDARSSHVAGNRHRLAVEFVHLHGDLRIFEVFLVSGDQVGLELLHGQASSMHLPDHGQGHGPIVVDLRRLVRDVIGGKYTNGDQIFRPQYVAGGIGGGRRWRSGHCSRRGHRSVQRSTDTTIRSDYALGENRNQHQARKAKRKQNQFGWRLVHKFTHHVYAGDLAEKYLRRGTCSEKSAERQGSSQKA